MRASENGPDDVPLRKVGHVGPPLVGDFVDVGLRRRQSDREVEPGTAADLGLQLQAAAHQLQDPLGDGQTQTGAFGLRARGFGLVKGLEDAVLLLWRDAGTGVGDFEEIGGCAGL